MLQRIVSDGSVVSILHKCDYNEAGCSRAVGISEFQFYISAIITAMPSAPMA